MKHTMLELAARTGVPYHRLDRWMNDGGLLTPLNPGRRRVQGRSEGFLFGRQAVFAACMGRLAEDAGLGYASVWKVIRYCDRADLKKRFAAGQTMLFANKASVQIGHKDAAVVSHGPIQLCVFDLAELWKKFNQQMDRLEAEEASAAAVRTRG